MTRTFDLLGFLDTSKYVPPAWWVKLGGSIPGSTAFHYIRTAMASPSHHLHDWLNTIFFRADLQEVFGALSELQTVVEQEPDTALKARGIRYINRIRKNLRSKQAKAKLPLSKRFLQVVKVQGDLERATDTFKDLSERLRLQREAREQEALSREATLQLIASAGDSGIRLSQEVIQNPQSIVPTVLQVLADVIEQQEDLDPGDTLGSSSSYDEIQFDDTVISPELQPDDDGTSSAVREVLGEHWRRVLETVIAPMLHQSEIILEEPAVDFSPDTMRWSKTSDPFLGSGAHGVVHLVRVEDGARKDQLIVLKEFHYDQSTKLSFIRECAALKAIARHPNIVHFLASQEDDKHSIQRIFLEYISGSDIRGVIDCVGHMPEAWCKGVLRQVLAGLSHLHANGIVHRDVKGDNVLISNQGHIKLTDFGTAKRLEDLRTLNSSLDSAQSIAGSMGFIAPEIIRKEGYTERADVWSAGCLFVHMLLGKFPWNDDEGVFERLWNTNKPHSKEGRIIVGPKILSQPVSDTAKKVLYEGVFVEEAERFTAEQLRGHQWLTG